MSIFQRENSHGNSCVFSFCTFFLLPFPLPQPHLRLCPVCLLGKNQETENACNCDLRRMPDEMGQRSAYRTAGWEPSENKTHFLQTECASSSFATICRSQFRCCVSSFFFQSAVERPASSFSVFVALDSVIDFGRWARSDPAWRGPCSEEVQHGTGCVRGRRFAVKMGGMREVLLTSRLETRCQWLCGRMLFDALTRSLRVFV